MSFMRERSVDTLTTETMRRRHLKKVLEIEEQIYPRPWTHRTFVSELAQMRAGTRYYLVAYVGDSMVGYGGMMFSFLEKDRVPSCRRLSSTESAVFGLLPLCGGLL